MIKKIKKSAIIFLLTTLFGCSTNQPANDFNNAKKNSSNTKILLSKLEASGYSCAESEMKENEARYFSQKSQEAKKYTCTKSKSGILCVDYLFIDIFSVKNKVIGGNGQVAPQCP
ncbi:conserved exported hypothetical protein [Pseudomonas sp. 8BK]|uniref:hypothetical protein n=1 Tax=Pseudomonas sp. 8BK TaxID=2653164 RepID=UPI0012EF0373|nr:hypothetical protein [Pseudomonas sp. 8BK]VXC06054.1 conserved exported hypothetical protein [Pseudomonas sp. 8BK]